MARGQSPALRVAVWAAGPFRALSSVSAHNAMEAVDVAATFCGGAGASYFATIDLRTGLSTDLDLSNSTAPGADSSTENFLKIADAPASMVFDISTMTLFGAAFSGGAPGDENLVSRHLRISAGRQARAMQTLLLM